MRSEDDFTAESFLNDPAPPGSNEPLYNGDAVGCKSSKFVHSLLYSEFLRLICFDTVLMNGWSKYYTRYSHLDISDIPDDTSIANLPTLQTPYLDKGSRILQLLMMKTRVIYLIDSFRVAY